MISQIKHFIKIFLLFFIEISPVIKKISKGNKVIVYANSYRRNSDKFIESISKDISVIKLEYKYRLSNIFFRKNSKFNFGQYTLFFFYSPGDYVENYFIKSNIRIFKNKQVYGIQHGLIGQRKPANINKIFSNLNGLDFIKYISFEESFNQMLNSFSIQSLFYKLDCNIEKTILQKCSVNVFFDAFDKNNFFTDNFMLIKLLIHNDIKISIIKHHPSSSFLKILFSNFFFIPFKIKVKTNKYIFWDSKLKQKYLSKGDVYFFKKNDLYKLFFLEDLEDKLIQIIKNA